MAMFLAALLVTTGISQVMTAPSPHSQLEDYLYRYGYLPATDRENGVKRSETDLEQATMRLQKFAGLRTTGKLDEPTLELIGKPRCGMPDMVVKHDDILGVVEANDGPANYTLLGSTWQRQNYPITYGFVNYTPDLAQSIVDRVIDESIKLWTDASGLECSRISDGNSADMKISFGALQHGSCPYPFDGQSGVLAHAFAPGYGLSGDTHFDEDETWTDGTYSGTNLKWVAIHEFGHAIGIGHSDVRNAIMYPYYTGYTPNPQLQPDDINAARAMYGDGTTTGSCDTKLGFGSESRTYVDSAAVQTMVLKESFSTSGEVKTIRVYSRNAGRRLRVSIYRPSGSQFTVVAQTEFDSIPVGENELALSGDDVLQVQAGDNFGFTWLDSGVVEFNFASTYNYYDSWWDYEVGDTAYNLQASRYGNREYSIQVCVS